LYFSALFSDRGGRKGRRFFGFPPPFFHVLNHVSPPFWFRFSLQPTRSHPHFLADPHRSLRYFFFVDRSIVAWGPRAFSTPAFDVEHFLYPCRYPSTSLFSVFFFVSRVSFEGNLFFFWQFLSPPPPYGDDECSWSFPP